MRILVTGATGFVGSHVVSACLRSGCEAGALVLPDEARDYERRTDGRVTVFAGTIESPPWKQLEQWQADACIHCAWIATPGEYLESPLNTKFLEWSKGFMARLAETGTQRLVGVGSCAERLVETMGPRAPLYARAKDELRQFLLHGCLAPRTAWARLFYPYGIGEAKQRLVSSLITAFAEGRTFSLRCPGTRKDYLHVGDAGRAFETLARGTCTGVVDIGTGVGVGLGDLAGIVASAMACEHLLLLGDETDPLGDMVGDASVLHAAGWSPSVTLSQGVRTMVERASGRAEH